MDKNRFYLILLLAIVIIILLFKEYKSIKNETFEKYQNIEKLSKKIDEINYLEKLYNNKRIIKQIKRVNKCKIENLNNYKINCNNLSKQEFQKLSNIVFNSSVNILKFEIQKKKQISFYMEINK